MHKHLLRLNLIISLLFLSAFVHAIPLLKKDLEDRVDIFSSDNLFSDYGVADEKSQLSADPYSALKQLERQFRELGNLGPILQHAPQLKKQLPSDSLLNYLHAIALSATGDVAAASIMVNTTTPTLSTKVYELMAKSMVAKGQRKWKEALSYAEQAAKADVSHPYPHNIMGRVYFEQGQLAKALNNFDRATKLAPQHFIAYTNAAAVKYSQGDEQGAAGLFTKALEIAPGYCAALIGRATVAQAMNKVADAITDLEKCKDNGSLEATARINLLELYISNAELGKAEQLAKELLKSEPDFASLSLGEIYLRENKISEAKNALNSIKKSVPKQYYLLAFAEFASGDLDAASSSANKALELQPNFVGASLVHGLLQAYKAQSLPEEFISKLKLDATTAKLAEFLDGNLKASRGQAEAALVAWRNSENFIAGFTSEKITPSQVKKGFLAAEMQYINIGVLLYTKQYYQLAEKEFTKAISKNPDSLLGNYFLALTYSHLNKPQLTLSHLEKTIAVAPEFFSANYALAELYLRSTRLKEAIKYYEVASKAKSDAGILVKLGLLFENQQDYKSAAKYYEQMTRDFPQNFIGFNQLAWLYAKQGINLDDALELAKKADKLQPNNISINDTLGWIHAGKKEFDKALSYLEKANQISRGQNPNVLYHLAYVQNKMGDSANAKANVNKALNMSNNFESKKAAEKLLTQL
ncbi:tetratricopeptide repeat protein [Kaarinaea lacus]